MKSNTMNYLCWACCGAGMALLTASDAMINFASAIVVGSSPIAVESLKYAAIGVSVSLVATGAILRFVKKDYSKWACGVIILVAAFFSAGLTIQAASVDYAANDHGGAIQSARQEQNKEKIKQYEKEAKTLRKKMKECERDRYYEACTNTERRLAKVNDKIAAYSDDTVESKLAEKVDIGDAVFMKAGIPSLYVERGIIFARAFAVPFLISLCSFGFWSFWYEIHNEKKKILR